jgi:hypothetical protein
MAAPAAPTTIIVFVCQTPAAEMSQTLHTVLATTANAAQISAPAPTTAAPAAAPTAAVAAPADAAPTVAETVAETIADSTAAVGAATDAAPTGAEPAAGDCRAENAKIETTLPCAEAAAAGTTEPTEKYIQLAAANVSFIEACRLLGIISAYHHSAGHGLHILPQSAAGHMKFNPGENVLGIFWDRYMAQKFDIRSTYGYLITNEARICVVKNNGDGTVGCERQLFAGVGPLPRDELLTIARRLSDSNCLPSDLQGSVYWQVIEKIQGFKFNYDARVSAQTKTPAQSQNIFATRCNKLSLSHGGCGLYGYGSFTVILQPDEFPYTRVRKSGSKHLIVTNFARLIWCEAGEDARCLDQPFGKACDLPFAMLNALIGQYLTGPAEWSGVEKFCAALSNQPFQT